MKAIRLRKLVAGALALVVLTGVLPLGAISGARLGLEPSGARALAQGGTTIHFPLLGRNYLDPTYRLSRFGVSHSNLLTSLQASLNSLRIGYHWDFTARQNPTRPGGIEYAQVIRLDPKSCFSYSPSGAALDSIIARNPGALWFIGNEPDRVREDEAPQDDITPECYARAYAHLYRLIKAKDPTARIAAGNIVEPTPMRLRYLDMVLQTYSEENGGAQMPVDVWSIHMYILAEDEGWGAKVPPGISDIGDAASYKIEDNYNYDEFKKLVDAFRKWMRDHGYQDTPLYVSEYGVLMPWNYIVSSKKPDDAEADAEAKAQADQIVSDYMAATVNYMLTKTSSEYGYPADKNRLVQRWAWYSHEDLGAFNGHLFDPVTKQRTAFGDRYAAIIAAQPATVNLYAWKMWTEPASPLTIPPKDPLNVRVYATVVNNGNVQTRNAVAVRFYDGNPDDGGAQIGGTQYIAPLEGGAGLATVSVPWSPTSAGTYDLHVRVDPLNAIAETDEGDNTKSIDVVVTS